MTDTTDHPSRRAGLRDEIAAALEAADYRLDMRRGDLADAIMPVLYREWPWLRAEAEDAASVVVPAADRAALRDPIAEACDGCSHSLHVANECPVVTYGERCVCDEGAPPSADAVLPAPAGREAVLNAAAQHLYTALFPAVYADMGQKAAEGVNRAVSELRRMAAEPAACRVAADTPPAETVDRAAILRELADQQEQTATTDVIRRRRSIATARRLFAVELRQMADEQPSPAAPAQPGKEATPFTPPAHYRRDDGVDCCVHTIPVGPDSCRECRELADDEQPGKEA